jgi:hypothetical protein
MVISKAHTIFEVLLLLMIYIIFSSNYAVVKGLILSLILRTEFSGLGINICYKQNLIFCATDALIIPNIWGEHAF